MKKLIGAIIIIGLASVVLYFYLNRDQGNQSDSMEELITSDGVKLAYDLYQAKGIALGQSKGWLVLIHMMPATKESWRDFAGQMQEAGLSSIAFDLRGHGQSDGGPDGHLNFSDAEHQASIKDIEAALAFLKSKDVLPEKTYLIGASIGANLTLQYIIEHPEFKKAVLLSPGLNYRGIETLPLVEKIQTGQRLLFVSSLDDGNNAEENRKLAGRVPVGIPRDLVIYQKAGHGTDMFEPSKKEKYDLTEAIRKFLEE